jgi:hypothetical protein
MSNVKNITHNIIEDTSIQRTLFRSLMVTLGLLSLTYLYLISSITFNVLARKTLDTTIRTLETSINASEIAYMGELNKIDKSYALSKGFVDVNQPIFAIRAADRVALR